VSGVLAGRSLSSDIHLLGDALGEVIRQHEGQRIFQQIGRIRLLAKELRARYSDDRQKEMLQLVDSLDHHEIPTVIRAFTVYFQLANLVEDLHRIRVLRKREAAGEILPESVEDAFRILKAEAVGMDRLKEILSSLDVELVFTAHPTEARRRTVLEKLQRLSRTLYRMEYMTLLSPERDEAESEVKRLILSLWETDELRSRPVSVLDEVKNGLYYLGTIVDLVPTLYRKMRWSIDKFHPSQDFRIPSILRFGSWIGSDRDGNPNVTVAVTERTLEMQRKAILEK